VTLNAFSITIYSILKYILLICLSKICASRSGYTYRWSWIRYY